MNPFNVPNKHLGTQDQRSWRQIFIQSASLQSAVPPRPPPPRPGRSGRYSHDGHLSRLVSVRGPHPPQAACVSVCVCTRGNRAMFKTEAHREWGGVKQVLDVKQLLNGAAQRSGSIESLAELQSVGRHRPSHPSLPPVTFSGTRHFQLTVRPVVEIKVQIEVELYKEPLARFIRRRMKTFVI